MFFKRKYRQKRRPIKIIGKPFLSVFFLFFLLLHFSFSSSYDKSWNFNWSGIRPQVKDSVLKIKRYGSLVTVPGEDESLFSQIKTQSWLFKNTETSELLSLLDFPDSNVKALTYSILLKKKKVDKYLLIKRSLKDTLSFVELSGGCLRFDMHLAEYVLKHELNFGLKKPINSYKIEDDLTFEQIIEIDSLFKNFKVKEELYKQFVYGEEFPITDYKWE